jgi:hypothetical protein
MTPSGPKGDPRDNPDAGMDVWLCQHRAVDKTGKDRSNKVDQMLWWGGERKDDQGKFYLTGDLGLGSGFHVYGLEWSESGYRFFIDGKLSWAPASPVSKQPHFLFLRCAVIGQSGTAGGIPAGGYGSRETSTTRMVVDYVRFYERVEGVAAATTAGASVVTTAAAPATGETKPPPAQPAAAKFAVRMIELQLDANGTGTLRVDSRTDPATAPKPAPAGGRPVKLGYLSGAEAGRLDDGRFRIIHDFSVFTNLDEHYPPSSRFQNSLAIDPARQALIFTPLARPNANPQFKWADLWYPRATGLPVTVRLDLAGFESHPLSVEMYFDQAGKVMVNFFGDTKKPRGVQVMWSNFEKREVKKLLEAEQLADSNLQYSFEWPASPELLAPRFRMQRVGQEVAVKRIEMTAGIPAQIGVQLEERKGQVVAKSVLEGAAARAGIRPGDVITTVGDTPVSTTAACIKAIRKFSPGETIRLGVLRDGQAVVVPVSAD